MDNIQLLPRPDEAGIVHRPLSIVHNVMNRIVRTKAERREAKHHQKMAVSGRNTKRLAQNIARRNGVDRKNRP